MVLVPVAASYQLALDASWNKALSLDLLVYDGKSLDRNTFCIILIHLDSRNRFKFFAA